MTVTPDLWLGKRVLVTGHTGFKGAWLSQWLAHLGANVYGLALPAITDPNLWQILPNAKSEIMGDIRDPANVTSAFERSEPEVVFHLAAQPLVRYGYAHPVETFDVNVMGTLGVLEAARQSPSVRAVVVVTSDKVYDDQRTERPYREGSPLGGGDPYSASKGCAELVAACYRRSFLDGAGIQVATVRAGNVLGGGDWSEDRLMPDIVRAWSDAAPLSVRYPDATRPWQHVLDPLHGYILTAERLLSGGLEQNSLNFGPPLEGCIPVRELIAITQGLLPGGFNVEMDDRERVREAPLLTLDSGRARQMLGWRPVLDLATCLSWTASWYVAFYGGQDVNAMCREQIEIFMGLATRTAGLGPESLPLGTSTGGSVGIPDRRDS